MVKIQRTDVGPIHCSFLLDREPEMEKFSMCSSLSVFKNMFRLLSASDMTQNMHTNPQLSTKHESETKYKHQPYYSSLQKFIEKSKRF